MQNRKYFIFSIRNPTNRDGKYLLSYDQETSSVKSTKKKYFFHDIISNAVKKIDLAYTNHKNKFKKEKQKQFEDIIVRLKEIKDYDFNNRMLKNIFDELNLLCYNSRNVGLRIELLRNSILQPSLYL